MASGCRVFSLLLFGIRFAQAAAGDSALTLPQAVERAVSENPALKALQWKIAGAQASASQAGLRANPSLGLQTENFAGTGDYAGARSLEATVTLSQPLETGGKRRSHRDLAGAEKESLELEYRAGKSRIALEVRSLFGEILLVQERLALAGQDLQTEQEFLETQVARRKAGKSPLMDEQRAKANLLTALLARARLERENASLRLRLSALMGAGPEGLRGSEGFPQVIGQLSELEPLPGLDSLLQAMETSPAQFQRAKALEIRNLELEVQRAEAKPDVDVEVGYRHSREVMASGFLLGLSMPLPFWNRNQGGIAAASARISQTQEEIRATQRQIAAALRESHGKLVGLQADLAFMRDSLLPTSQSAYHAAQEGYRMGRFSPLEVLDARRAYNETNQAFLEALADYHRQYLELEKLMQTGGNGSMAREGRE